MARHYPTLTRSGFLLPSNIKASYEGAGEGRRSASWDAPDVGINSLNTPALRNLRARSRAAVRNDPYAFNVIDKRVSNLIGTGISPRPKTEDDALRKREQELWDDWVEESDADGLTDFYLPSIGELSHGWQFIPEHFKRDWHWSSTQRSASHAFTMSFDGGYQGDGD